jgi:hypothetical protein
MSADRQKSSAKAQDAFTLHSASFVIVMQKATRSMELNQAQGLGRGTKEAVASFPNSKQAENY